MASFKDVINLKKDSASLEEIQQRVDGDSTLKGANLIILMTAIFVASVGLNVNSTAVIIGAMLISPLMGAIVATGYGMSTYDWKYIKQSMFKLFFQVAVALLTSAIYFSLTPLTAASSELLARTTPTFWDVIIALCGGIAGAIGLTRQEKSNVIPGVAIATALMPPLCTAGYGIAMHNVDYFLGAFYLFFINSFFIALASFIIFKLMRIPCSQTADALHFKRQCWALWILGFVVTVPSFYTAYQSVDASLVESQVKTFISQEARLPMASVVSYKVAPDSLTLDVVGRAVTAEQKEQMQADMQHYSKLQGRTLKVVQGDHSQALSTEEVENIVDARLGATAKAGDESYKSLAARYYPSYKQYEADRKLVDALATELPVLFPQVQSIQGGSLLDPNQKSADDLAKREANGQTTFVLLVKVNSPMAEADQQRMQQWLEQRTGQRVLLQISQ